MLLKPATTIRDTDPPESASPAHRACEAASTDDIVGERMVPAARKPVLAPQTSVRRVVVAVVPPVDELDLVGPLQVFNSVNRLAGKTIYSIEVVTSADRLTVEGEGGVLTFVA